jgi:hypothetical protein
MYYALKHHVAPRATFLPQRQVGGKQFFLLLHQIGFDVFATGSSGPDKIKIQLDAIKKIKFQSNPIPNQIKLLFNIKH